MSLKRLRSTCKRWNTLFKDQRFTEKHFRQAPKLSQLLMLKENGVCSMSVNLNPDVAPPSISFKGALRLGLNDSVDIAQVFHCDGLLVCTTKDNRLVVWNPCLGETRWIQHKNGYTSCSRFALGYQTNKSGRSYKILRGWDSEPDYRFEIYELGSDSWRVLDDEKSLYCLVLPNPVSLRGNTFWIIWDFNFYNRYVLNFDFTTERFTRLSLPQFQNPGRNRALSVVREEQLSVLSESVSFEEMEIWVTTKVDTKAALSWSKSFTLDLLNIHSNWIPLFGSFLIDEEKKVAVCCPCIARIEVSTNMVYIIGKDEKYYTEVPYVESTNKSSCLDNSFGESTNKKWYPLIFSYVPSLVHIHQDR